MGKYIIRDTLFVPVDGIKRDKQWLAGDIAIQDDLIAEIGPNLTAKYPDYEVIDGKNSLVLPGLINCHTHAAMTMLRSYADDLPLQEWLETKIWPREAHLQSKDIYWGTMLSILEMIKSGTTTFADMYFFMEQTAKAVEETGIRASLSRGMVGLGDSGELAFKESEELVKNWHGKAEGRISCLLGPHAPYTCTPDYLERVMKLADSLKVGLHIHLAETLTEVENITKEYGLPPIKLMDSLGLFDGRHVLAAHCVHLTEEEIDILVKKKVGIAHNPESNMKLASGIAPIPQLLAAGALVGLGTDGASSNNNLDMIGEMHTCALLHKVATGDPTVLSAYQVLEMATLKGAQALGLEKLGSLQPGYKADLIMLDLHKAHLTPHYDPIANLAYAAHSSDVKTVIIDGNLVMKDYQLLTIDEERVIFEAERLGQDLISRQ